MLFDLILVVIGFIMMGVLVKDKKKADIVKTQDTVCNMVTCVKDETKVCTKSLCPPDDVRKGLCEPNNTNGVRRCCLYRDYVQQNVENG